MRRWFVIVLIVLLPWRAWAGDAMMLSMPSTAEHAPTATTPHCADQAVADPSGAEGLATHAVCDICNGPLLAASSPAPAGQAPLPQARLATGPVRFASALPHPGHKPPIS